MHHFGSYRAMARTCAAGFAAWLLMGAGALAEAEKPGKETLLGVADVERILNEYWRTAQVRAELDRYKISEDYRQKQEEAARLERELSDRRFAFFRDRRANKEILERRDELSRLAEKEAARAREREKEAIEQLLTEIRRGAESIGRQNGHAVIFDGNTPHIVFMATQPGKVDDVTDAVIHNLNSN